MKSSRLFFLRLNLIFRFIFFLNLFLVLSTFLPIMAGTVDDQITDGLDNNDDLVYDSEDLDFSDIDPEKLVNYEKTFAVNMGASTSQDSGVIKINNIGFGSQAKNGEGSKYNKGKSLLNLNPKRSPTLMITFARRCSCFSVSRWNRGSRQSITRSGIR